MAMGGRKVFLSYCHESAEHDHRVQELVLGLRRAGFDCTFDLDLQAPEAGWLEWMKERLAAADRVLVVMSPNYGQERPDGQGGRKGLGSVFELTLLRNELYEGAMRTRRLVFVLLEETPDSVVPLEFRQFTRFRPDSPEGFEKLVQHLRGESPGQEPAGARMSQPTVRRRVGLGLLAALGLAVVVGVIGAQILPELLVSTPSRPVAEANTKPVPPAALPPPGPSAGQERGGRPAGSSTGQSSPLKGEVAPGPPNAMEPFHLEFELGDGESREFLGGSASVALAFHRLGEGEFPTLFLEVDGQPEQKELVLSSGASLPFQLRGKRYLVRAASIGASKRRAKVSVHELDTQEKEP